MEKNLRKKIIYILEQCEEVSPFGADYEDIHTVHLLQDEGYITRRSGSLSYTSLTGREYLERLKAPRKAWLKKRWLRVSIATIMAFAALATVIVQIVSLILE